MLLGILLENITGIPYWQLCRERIFDPLDMRETWLEGYEEPRNALSHPYVVMNGEYIDALQIHGSVDWAAGGHVSTLADITRFMRGLFNCRLFSSVDTLDSLLTGPEASANYYYAMGVGRKQIHGMHLWGHLGHWGSFMSYCPEQRMSLCGTLNYDQAAQNDFIAEVLKVVFPDKRLELRLSTGLVRGPAVSCRPPQWSCSGPGKSSPPRLPDQSRERSSACGHRNAPARRQCQRLAGPLPHRRLTCPRGLKGYRCRPITIPAVGLAQQPDLWRLGQVIDQRGSQLEPRRPPSMHAQTASWLSRRRLTTAVMPVHRSEIIQHTLAGGHLGVLRPCRVEPLVAVTLGKIMALRLDLFLQFGAQVHQPLVWTKHLVKAEHVDVHIQRFQVRDMVRRIGHRIDANFGAAALSNA